MTRFLTHYWQPTGLLLVLVFLAVIPVETLATFPVVCMWRNLLGMNCPTCGLTRAVACLLHGRFTDAFNFNPLAYVILPLSILHVGRRI